MTENGDLEDVLSADEERAVTEALRAAWAPATLDAARNRLLIELALEDPFAAPTDEEVAESERLRLALDGVGSHAGADLLRAVGAAIGPAEVDPKRARSLAEAAVTPRSNVIRVAFGAGAAVLALAAATVLFVTPAADELAPAARASAERAELAVRVAFSRSTSSLFDDKFDLSQTTARIDRIAAARGRDLRTNRYAAWGVR